MKSLQDEMENACAEIGISVPRNTHPGRWAVSAVVGKRDTNTSGRVLIFDDQQGGIAYNWATGQQKIFNLQDSGDAVTLRRRPDPDKARREAEEAAEVERLCDRIVRACRHEPHPYLAAKGFPDELALVHDDPRAEVSDTRFGKMLADAMPEANGPVLIVPGRIGGKITTIQIITADGTKKNILRGKMGGASHRIASGRQAIVCEGIATACSVRAAVRLLGVSATVLAAFSAANVAKVAMGMPGAFIAADHDKPIETLNGKGTGEFYASQSGLQWSMPPQLGDFNDMQMSVGLRAVALHLREVIPP